MQRETVRMTTRSTAAEIDARNAGQTVPKMFLGQLAEQPDFPLLNSMRDDGGWDRWTVADVARLAARTAAGLAADGVAPGERVMLMMRNRPDFHWLDLGAQFVRATPVSIYNSSSPEEIQYLAGHAGARIAIVEDDGYLQRMLAVRDELPELERTAGCPRASDRSRSCSGTATPTSTRSRPTRCPTTSRPSSTPPERPARRRA
jgi:long-chain acyl-CoA synthetase